MTVLTLLVKVRSAGQLKLVDALLKAEFENLDVDSKLLGAPVNKWVQVSLSGEDEVIATNYLAKEVGTCPINAKRIDKDSVLKGYIVKIDMAKNELTVDVGVFEPKVALATVPLATLQAQLAGGKKVDLKKIAEAYALQEDLPIEVRVVDSIGSTEDSHFKAELSTAHVEKMRLWQQSLLDRLIVLGATSGEIEDVLQRTRLDRDVIGVERLGFFEHALTCKLGTDAAGLIPRMGRYMRYSAFVIFSFKRVSVLIGETPLTL
jgi:hypothetical protein